ncbi:MAG: serine/threonine protein kinase, partial [Myxococcales bacterium]|nr:serine/threonine protein kinase [Myxococcales bacterium]
RDVAERIAAVRAAPAGGDERGDDAGAASAAEAPAAPMLSDRELQLLASQVAHAAAEQLKRQTDLAALMAASASVQAARLQDAVAGLERQPLQVDLLYDSAVAAAKVGPSIDTLRRFIHGPCDLQNIEVYFRVGLAHLAAGDWAHALEAFDAVEDASPGYRDAWKRADEIRAWQAALGPRMSQLGVVASSPGKADGGDGRYQLRGELGRGGMAVVYRGYDSVLGREVALKFLSEEISAQDDMRELFQREARAVASLNHPNIVTIHDVGVLEGRAFICMEFVDGRSIESLIMESPGLTIVESMRIAKQALDALAYAHGRDIIHRDIKPANMMRTSAGLVKLMDFGLAKSMSDRKKTSYIAGTPAYMAPEHLRGDELDARADLFAIGVSLYEMLSGQLPYAGLDRHEPPVPLAERVPAIPPRLAEAVMRALEFDRARRWPSAEAMVAPIQQILDAVSRFAGGGVGTAPLGDGPASHPGPVGGTAPTVAQVPTGPRRTAERTVALDSGKGTLKLK